MNIASPELRKLSYLKAVMPEPFQLTEHQRQIGDVIADFVLRVARPLYWHNGAHAENRVVQGGSTFLLRFQNRFIAVTADHVLDAYLRAKQENPELVCQIHNARVFPEKSLVSRSQALDIATFEVSPLLVPLCQGHVLNCDVWPPPDVAVGDAISVVGYPENMRQETAPGRMDFAAWGAAATIDAVTEREIVTTYDPAREFAPQWAPDGLPPLGFNLSGASGGPAILHRRVGAIQLFFPVGVIVKGPTGQAPGEQVGERAALGELAGFDRFHMRRLTFLRPDGSVEEPNQGWLPG